MSRTVDERVVSMQFDNQHFEKNVSTTMSTLDKLKEKLNFTGATKGLQDVSSAAGKVNMSGLASGIETVHAKFSALEVMGVTALANITNSAVNAGKRIVSALTIQPVTTGFNEYELKMGSIQTIMASTGESLETVNGYLEELNEYSDKTIYSFSDMTQNIGKFTNAGVKLEDAVSAIKGISNEAAVSGANANEASRAMYNFAQALSAGYVKLIDWKSIENANMATVEFKNQLIEAAVAAGTLEKSTDGMYKVLTKNNMGSTMDLTISATKNFNDSLNYQWMTTEVLVNTLKNYADENTDIGKKAFSAAQDVKTLSMMFDTLKESAQSGWARTWEIVIGDLEEAKSLLTPITNAIGGFIDKMSDARNAMLETALGGSSKWNDFVVRIGEAGISSETFTEALKETLSTNGRSLDDLLEKYKSLDKVFASGKISVEDITKTFDSLTESEKDNIKMTEEANDKLAYFQKVVDEVWNGKYGNKDTGRIERLTEAGYDYAQVQELVNKTIDGQKLTLEDLNETQMENLGFTKEQIKAIQKLRDEAQRTGTPLRELIESMVRPSGRELIIEAVAHALEELQKPLEIFGDLWDKTFGKINFGEILYGIIENMHELVMSMEFDEKDIENFQKIADALGTLYNISSGIAGKSIASIVKIVDAVLGLFDMDILDLAGKIADYIVQFGKMVEANSLYINSVDKIAQVIATLITGIDKVVSALWNLKPVQDFIKSIGDTLSDLFGGIDVNWDTSKIDTFCKALETMFNNIESWINSLNDSENIGKDFVDGLIKGIWNGIKGVVDAVKKLADIVIQTVCGEWLVNSPSKVMMAIGAFLVAGLIIGITSGFTDVWTTIKEFAQSCIDKFKEVISKVDFGKVLAGAYVVGIIVVMKKLYDISNRIIDVVDKFAAIPKGIGDMFKNLGSMFKSIGDGIEASLKADAMKKRSQALLDIAKAILMLAAALFVISKIDEKRLWSSVGVFAALSAILVALSFACTKIGGIKGDIFKASTFVGLGAALLMLAGVMKILSGIELKDMPSIVAAFTTMIVGLGAILFIIGKTFNAKMTKDASKAVGRIGGMLIKLSVALLIMIGVIKLASMLDGGEVKKAAGVIAAVSLLFGAMIVISKLSGQYSSKAGTMLIKMAAAMVLMLGVIKIASMMDQSDVYKGIKVVALLELLFAGLIAISKLAGKNSSKAGFAILSMSIALMAAVKVVDMASKLEEDEIKKGITVMGALSIMFAALIAVSHFAGQHALKAGMMLLLISGALAIVVGIMYIVSKMDPSEITPALGVISVLSILFMGLIAATKNAQDCVKNIMWFTIAIAVLVGAVVALSFIDTNKLIASAGAISALMGMFAILMVTSSKMKNTKQLVRTLLTLSGVVVILAGVVAALSFVNPESVLPNVAALSILLLAFSTSLVILGKAGRISTTVSKQIPIMLGVVAGLALILGLLAGFNVEPSIQSALALGILLNAMATAMVILGYTTPLANTSIGALALMGLVVGELAIILGLMEHFNVEPSIETALSLSILLLAMSGALAILAPVGAMGPAAFIGIAALATMIAGIGGLIVGIGALVDKFPALETFLNKGIPILEDIGVGIGSFFGGIVGGFLDSALTSGLPGIAEDLSEFMESLQPFVEGAKDITEESVAGVKSIAEIFAVLAGANLLNSFTEWLTGGSSISDFASQLGIFGDAMADFSSKISGKIDEDAVMAAANAGKMLAEMADTIPNSGGLASIFAGENDMEDFAAQLKGFGEAIVDFSEEISGNIDEEAVLAAANAGKMLAEMAATIPNSGGLLGAIVGDNDIDDFATQLTGFGEAIVDFSEEVKGNIDEEAVQAAANAGKVIGEMARNLPNSGGLLADLIGDNNMDVFSSQLVKFGEGIVSFVEAVSSLSEGSVEKAATAGKIISKMATEIPNTLMLFSVFNGSTDMATFGYQLTTFGTSLVSFTTQICNIDASMVESTIASIGTLKTALAEFTSTAVNSILTTISSTQPKVVTEMNNMLKVIMDAIKLKYKDMKDIGKRLLTNFTDGIKAQQPVTTTNIVNAFNAIVKAVTDKKQQYYDGFSSVGKYMMQGLAAGISAGASAAISAAVSVAVSALAAAKAALGIASPSKEFYSIGEYIVAGFANGISDNARNAEVASTDMANSTINGFSAAISKIKDAIDTDIDAQPTIRPVLDLSDVTEGAGMIDGLFNMNPSVGLMTNVGAISSMMNSGQNGGNGDIISAIKDLMNTIGNTSGDTYNINGVTYDDGSNISDAVSEIIRAARVERRT